MNPPLVLRYNESHFAAEIANMTFSWPPNAKRLRIAYPVVSMLVLKEPVIRFLIHHRFNEEFHLIYK